MTFVPEIRGRKLGIFHPALLAAAAIILGGGANAAAQTAPKPLPIPPPVSPSIPMSDSSRPANDRFNSPPMAPPPPTARQTQRRTYGTICGNPKVACRTEVTFQPHDLPFRLSQNAVIWESELFYAVMLKSKPAKDDNCDVFIPETDRLAAQALFPDRKVFASRCVEPGEMYYTNTKPNQRIMAVYAGKTLAEANRVLAAVKATGKFPGANVRRMRTGFNGT